MEAIVTPDVQAESSPAPLEVPRDPAAYAEWRHTGKIPDPPAKEETSAQGHEKPAGKAAPASEAGKNQQEKAKPRDTAATRLAELLEDIKNTGMTPAELKTFRKQAAAAEPAPKPQAPEKTVNPAEDLKEPEAPDASKFATYEDLDAAQKKYVKDYATWAAKKAVQDDRQAQAQERVKESVGKKMEEARTRYGDEGVSTISGAARALSTDANPAVVGIINDSEVWPDLCFTLGGKAEELAEFVHLSKTNPSAAIRKVVLMEQLITAELAKGGKAAEATETDGTARDHSGKFAKPAGKKESDTPPPPHEVSGRGTAPGDEVQKAVAANDFRTFMGAQNRRDLTSRKR